MGPLSTRCSSATNGRSRHSKRLTTFPSRPRNRSQVTVMGTYRVTTPWFRSASCGPTNLVVPRRADGISTPARMMRRNASSNDSSSVTRIKDHRAGTRPILTRRMFGQKILTKYASWTYSRNPTALVIRQYSFHGRRKIWVSPKRPTSVLGKIFGRDMICGGSFTMEVDRGTSVLAHRNALPR